jgi:hypothetical protein
MTPEQFRFGLATLTAYYGAQPNDTQYKLLWESVRMLSASRFDAICRYLLKEFVQTSMNPFPIVSHFNDARKNTFTDQPENTCPQIPDKSELPTPAEVRQYMEDIKRQIKRPERAEKDSAVRFFTGDKGTELQQIGEVL